MTTTAISSFSTLLKIGDGATSEAFATIAEITKLGGPKMSANVQKFLTQDSANAFVQKLVTSLDAGSVDLEFNFVPTGATHSQSSGLIYAYKNRTKRNFQIVWPDVANTTWAFTAVVSAFETTEDADGVLTGKATLEISGSPTFAG